MRPFSAWTHSLRFNCKKHDQKRKISFYTKYVQDTKMILINNILRFRKIYKFPIHYFFIGVISFDLYIRNDFIKIKN